MDTIFLIFLTVAFAAVGGNFTSKKGTRAPGAAFIIMAILMGTILAISATQ